MTIRSLITLGPAALALGLSLAAKADTSEATMPGSGGDAAAGQAKSAVCAACHGADGNSVNPEWPKLAGQHPSYTAVQLEHFKSGKRQNALMSAQAMGLSEQDMLDLAAYYAEQPIKGGEADPDLVGLGERIYQGGDKTNGVAACIACHGPSGLGNPLADYPSLAGQHARYTALQLKAYAAGERRSDTNQIMRNIAGAMTDDQIEAVASYIEGMR